MSELMQRLDNLRALIQTPEFLEGKGLSTILKVSYDNAESRAGIHLEPM